jgi:hypothetical protein
MKSLRAISILVLCIMFLFASSSCVVLVRKDNGLHKGWFKNPGNPHNPHNTHFIKQGRSKGNSKK